MGTCGNNEVSDGESMKLAKNVSIAVNIHLWCRRQRSKKKETFRGDPTLTRNNPSKEQSPCPSLSSTAGLIGLAQGSEKL
jgi:hypothetical protein